VASLCQIHVDVQIFGIQKNQDVRKALRFFSERRVTVHFVDFAQRAASLGELRHFAQKLGVGPLINKDSKRYAELGLGAVRYDEEQWLSKLVEEPLVLVVPLARFQKKVTVGLAEQEWVFWVEQARA